MYNRFLITSLLPVIFLLPLFLSAQADINIHHDESWWGASNSGKYAPLEEGDAYEPLDVVSGPVATMLLSSKGRYVWSAEPFAYRVKNAKIMLSSDHEIKSGTAGAHLMDAYQYVRTNFGDGSVVTPASELFEMPRYDLHKILLGKINQSRVVSFVADLSKVGMPKGILIFADGWQQSHGDWIWDQNKYPDPKGMIDLLHDQGYKVMVSVSPYVSPDTERFRYLASESHSFVKDPVIVEEPKIIKWRQGYSALLDMGDKSNVLMLQQNLTQLQKESGVDGFVFEDIPYGQLEDATIESGVTPCQLIKGYTSLAKKFTLSQSAVGCSGISGVSVVTVDELDWSAYDQAIQAVTHQSLLGSMYASLASPDMTSIDSVDQELVVRLAQVQALLPATEVVYVDPSKLSAPFRKAYLEAFATKKKLSDSMKKVIGGTRDGKPMIQTMALAYPDAPKVHVTDQFMIGDKILVAPITQADQKVRVVQLPKGIWLGPTGKGYQGPMDLKVPVKLDETPYFTKAVVRKRG